MTATKKRAWLAGAALVSMVAIAAYAATRSSRPPYETWWALGAVQVLEGPDEVWVFAELEGFARTPDPLVSPNTHVFERRQRIAVFGAEGLRETFDFAGGPLFSSNCSTIFRRDGRLYLFQGRSLSRPDELFAWGDPGFQRRSEHDLETLRNALGVPGANWSDVQNRLDEASNRDGWQRIFGESSSWDLDVTSTTTGVRLYRKPAGRLGTLIAESTDENARWSATILAPPEPPATVAAAEYQGLMDAAFDGIGKDRAGRQK